jgi:hypothetical protein
VAPDTSATQEFFEKRQAAAVLKHAIQTSYLAPRSGKTGSTSVNHRVAIGDCYAGAGRYTDGSPGSPAIIASIAQEPGLRGRKRRGLLHRGGSTHIPATAGGADRRRRRAHVGGVAG